MSSVVKDAVKRQGYLKIFIQARNEVRGQDLQDVQGCWECGATLEGVLHSTMHAV